MAKFYIAWNEHQTEGFITDSIDDAKIVISGRFRGCYSTAGAAFREVYDYADLRLQSVDIDPLPEKEPK